MDSSRQRSAFPEAHCPHTQRLPCLVALPRVLAHHRSRVSCTWQALSENELRGWYAECDFNGDGLIECAEFEAMVRSQWGTEGRGERFAAAVNQGVTSSGNWRVPYAHEQAVERNTGGPAQQSMAAQRYAVDPDAASRLKNRQNRKSREKSSFCTVQ